jgi:hypothetical protein
MQSDGDENPDRRESGQRLDDRPGNATVGH